MTDEELTAAWCSRKPRILAVDDSPINLAVLVHMLRRDYEVTIATSGTEALRIAAGDTFDLVLLDIMMPELDGFETLKSLNELAGFELTPVIFITANNDVGSERAGLRLGAVDYITKPFNVELVQLRIANVLHRASLQRDLALALDSAGQGLWEWHLAIDRVRIDPRRGEPIDLPDSQEAVGVPWAMICHPADLPGLAERARRYGAGDLPAFDVDVRLRNRAGHWVWMNVYGKASEHDPATGAIRRIKGTCRNVHDRKLAEEAVRASESQLQYVLAATGEGIWDWRLMSDTVSHNQAWCRILGLSELDIEHPLDSFRGLIHPGDAEAVELAIISALGGHGDYESEHRLRHTDGHYVWVHDRGKVVAWGEDGSPLRMVGSIRDITAQKAAEAEIEKLAFFDTLTGLPNRRLLTDRLRIAIAKNHRSNELGAAMFIDMDRFKELNDTLGHDMGDLLLIEIARRLQSCVREHDTVARLGGDEFIVMLEGLDPNPSAALADAQGVGRKVLEVLNQPYQLRAHPYRSSPSIGLTLFSGRQDTVESVLKAADIAMYEAKAAGRNCLRCAPL